MIDRQICTVFNLNFIGILLLQFVDDQMEAQGWKSEEIKFGEHVSIWPPFYCISHFMSRYVTLFLVVMTYPLFKAHLVKCDDKIFLSQLLLTLKLKETILSLLHEHWFFFQPKELQSNLTLLQLQRFIGVQHKMDAETKQTLVNELVQRYKQGLKFGEYKAKKIWH